MRGTNYGHNHIGPVAEHLWRLELVNEREDVTMIPAQQLPQMRAAPGKCTQIIWGLARKPELLGCVIPKLTAALPR